jgi:hypothetical protein
MRDSLEPVARLRIIWEEPQQMLRSFAQVIREICRRLAERGRELTLWPNDTSLRSHDQMALPPILARCLHQPLSGLATVHVRHQWPPHFDPPAAGHWVVIQPWEFGSLPRSWVRLFAQDVDEFRVPTNLVHNCFLRSGVPPDRVHVIPYTVDPGQFHSRAAPLPLRTRKHFKCLLVGGGTIYRKALISYWRPMPRASPALTTFAWSSRTWALGRSTTAKRRERKSMSYWPGPACRRSNTWTTDSIRTR